VRTLPYSSAAYHKQDADQTATCAIALTPYHINFLGAHKKYHEDNNLAPEGYLSALGPDRDATSSRSFDEKPIGDSVMMEVVPRNV
jgi:hypothetical protein